MKTDDIPTPTVNASATTRTSSHSKPGKRRGHAGSRGPRPGKYQNGRVCFSSWFPTEFMVRLRRFSTNLGSDPSTVILREISSLTQNTRLTDEDLAEIAASDMTLTKRRNDRGTE